MLELRRLRLLHELHQRGTIAAAAQALHLTPSAVSQQLSLLEREAGVPLLQKAGRGVRLTDAGLVLAEHADALLARTRQAEADLAQAAGTVAGRVRIAGFQSALIRLVIPAMERLATTAPRLRIELVEAEPEHALPRLARGDLDVVLGDEWHHQAWPLPAGVVRDELLADPVYVVLPEAHPQARAGAGKVSLAELRDEVWVGGHADMGWESVIETTCQTLGGFTPDLRHRVNDATVATALVASGQAVTMLPDFVLTTKPRAGIAIRRMREGDVTRRIFAATREVDARRPSTRAVLDALR